MFWVCSAAGRRRSQPKILAPFCARVRAVAAPLPQMFLLLLVDWPMLVKRTTLSLNSGYMMCLYSVGGVSGLGLELLDILCR